MHPHYSRHINGELTSLQLFFLNQVFFKIETGCTKLSISVVYMNIFHHAITKTVRVSRIVNYGLAFVIAGYYTAGSLVSFFQCTPVHKAWDSATPGKCIDNDQFRLANGYINIITSVWLIIMPFPALLSVQRRNKELWQFLGLVALGLMYDTACSLDIITNMGNTLTTRRLATPPVLSGALS